MAQFERQDLVRSWHQPVCRCALSTCRTGQPADARAETVAEEALVAVCVASAVGAPIIDTLVVRPGEAYSLEMTVRVREWPALADQCHVQPVTTLGRAALSLPHFTSRPATASRRRRCRPDRRAAAALRCGAPIQSPAIDCPLIVIFTEPGREETVEAAGYRRLQLRPFDPWLAADGGGGVVAAILQDHALGWAIVI